jgi:hypothetical protein
MTSRRRSIGALTILSLGAAFTLGSDGRAFAQQANHEFLVAIDPTANAVTVTNFPTTNAVTVTNFPGVQQVAFATPPTVTVGNASLNVAATAPLPVVEAPVPQPVMFDGQVTVPALAANTVSDANILTTVPAGKRLVIETVSGNITVSVGESVLYARLDKARPAGGGTGGAFEGVLVYFTPTKTGTDGTSDFYNFTAYVRAYVDENTNVVMDWVRQTVPTDGVAVLNLTVAGHLESL